MAWPQSEEGPRHREKGYRASPPAFWETGAVKRLCSLHCNEQHTFRNPLIVTNTACRLRPLPPSHQSLPLDVMFLISSLFRSALALGLRRTPHPTFISPYSFPLGPGRLGTAFLPLFNTFFGALPFTHSIRFLPTTTVRSAFARASPLRRLHGVACMASWRSASPPRPRLTRPLGSKSSPPRLGLREHFLLLANQLLHRQAAR